LVEFEWLDEFEEFEEFEAFDEFELLEWALSLWLAADAFLWVSFEAWDSFLWVSFEAWDAFEWVSFDAWEAFDALEELLAFDEALLLAVEIKVISNFLAWSLSIASTKGVIVLFNYLTISSTFAYNPC